MRYESAFRRLEAELGGSVSIEVPLSEHTTFRIGGPAALMVDCVSVEDVRRAIRILADERVGWACLGGGSNILAADTGYDGAVLKLSGDLAVAAWSGAEVRAGGGCTLARIVREASERHAGGLEAFVGIPGTLGGAVVMNAGSRHTGIGSFVRDVDIVGLDGILRRLEGTDVAWSYRSSGLMGTGVVVSAALAFEPADPVDSAARRDEALRRRRETQPLGMPNAGSVFVNPPGDSSGRLIESCGLKGARVGDAAVSDVHANFIVNLGDATASDVLGLVELIRDTVEKETDVTLEPEIRFLGAIETA